MNEQVAIGLVDDHVMRKRAQAETIKEPGYAVRNRESCLKSGKSKAGFGLCYMRRGIVLFP